CREMGEKSAPGRGAIHIPTPGPPLFSFVQITPYTIGHNMLKATAFSQIQPCPITHPTPMTFSLHHTYPFRYTDPHCFPSVIIVPCVVKRTRSSSEVWGIDHFYRFTNIVALASGTGGTVEGCKRAEMGDPPSCFSYSRDHPLLSDMRNIV
uniref:Uncharacterized protein n=1 Tax=Chrysemys picta bellii TaxID=8478 RepID=A0A8C3FE91_CHRPI